MKASSFKKICIASLVCLSLVACKTAEERAAEHYENGLKLIEAGDQQRALVEFLNTLQISADNIEARRKMAEVQKDMGRFNAAYRSYLQLVERAPDDLDGRINLGALAFETQEWEEFERHGSKALELAPDDIAVKAIEVGLNYRQAVIENNTSERSAVLARAEKLAEDLPESFILRRVRIDGYIEEQKYDAALELIDEAIARTPEDMSLYNSKLQLLALLGDLEGLEASLRNMITIFPDDITPKQTILRFLLSQQRIDDAEDLLEEFFANAPTPEKRHQAFVDLVQFISSVRGLEAAQAKIEETLAANPDNDAWKVMRAALKFESGERDSAIAEVESILAAETSTLTDQERQSTKITFAGMLLTTGNEVGARREVEEILETDPNSVAALKMKANWLIQEDNTAEAISALRTVVENAPDDADAMVLMARAYERAGDKKLSQEFLSLAVDASNNAPRYSILYANALIAEENLLQAEQTLISSLRIEPNNLEILDLLGKIYLAQEDIPRAQRVAETLGGIDLPRAQEAANILNAGILAQQAGADQALAFLEQLANEEGDENVRAKLNLIQAQLRTGKTEEATELAKQLVDDNPDSLQLRNVLAQAYSVAGNFPLAETEYVRILEAEPRLSSIWVRLARVRATMGNAEAARKTVEQGLAAVPEAPDLLWGKASYLEADGDIDGAIAIYEALYETLSDSPVIANNLASLLSTHRADEESLNRARTISRRLKDTDIPAFQDTYGWILHQSGNTDEAIPYLEAAAAGLPDDPRVQYHLGASYAAAGRGEDAQKQLTKALALTGPIGNQQLAETIRSQLSEITKSSE